MAKALSQSEIYDIFMTELKARDTTLTDDSPGSFPDVFAGATSIAVAQVMLLLVSEFAKTFFDSAHGPDITGGPDDLENLALDHFGDNFARPDAVKATGTVTFSRANADAGAVTIPSGTELSTDADSSGARVRFVTTAEVSLGAADLTVDASVEAVVGGTAGNVSANKITNVDSTLTDSSITVNNSSAMAGGTNEETDTQYRQTIKNLIQTLRGAALSALEAKAKAVSGVYYATAIETMIPVIEYDIGGGVIASGAEYFRVPFAKIYIADSNGSSSASLIASVKAEVDKYRAAGVKVEILGAVAVNFSWTASITLDVGGPNFAELSSDPSKITDSMQQYVADLPVGTGFVKSTADAAMLAIWGPDGTGDLSAGGFVTSSPVGDVDVAENEKLIPNNMTVS